MLDTDRYAGKKRKKPVQKHKPAGDVTKSNPSKRHRDRLNSELDRLNDMLPFHQNVCSRLDKLSVLRLSVGYLKVKNFFKATMRKNALEHQSGNNLNTSPVDAVGFSEGDLLLQALNGFVLVVTAEGYVFYASPTIQDYLGFHQSDVVHQSVFEFIHVDDRAMFRRQLHFALNPNPTDVDCGADETQSSSDITRNIVTYDPQHIPPENSSFLERSFVCQFRCLLDNSSGFLKLNFQGRLKFLHGQQNQSENGSSLQPQLALFAVATPVQPPAIVEIRTKTLIFQTKHKLDFTPLGIDSRGKVVLGYTEMELCMRGSGYQFIHAADMMHCADSHVKMMKTGASGMTVFRLLTKNDGWVWVQANARIVYKDGRPDFIIARQRALVNAEGEEHLRKRSIQLPFSFTTGEAVLYDTCPTLHPATSASDKTSHPSSLISSMERQDKSIYGQSHEPRFTLDDAFVDSWALFNVPTRAPQAEKSPDAVASVMEALEQLAQDGDLDSALREMEVDGAASKDWEDAILRMTRDRNGNDASFGLNEILTNEIFSYVEDALFKESNEDPGVSVKPDAPGGHLAAPVGVKPELELIGQEMSRERLGYTEASPTRWRDLGSITDPSKDFRLTTHCQNCGFKVGSDARDPPSGGRADLSMTDNDGDRSVPQGSAPPCDTSQEINQSPDHFQYGKTAGDTRSDSLSPSNSWGSSEMSSLSPGGGTSAHQVWPNVTPGPAVNRFGSLIYYQTLPAPMDHSDRSQNYYSDQCNNLVNGVYHSVADPLSSCVFETRSPAQQHPQAQAVTISSSGKSTTPANQSPPEAACYYNWLQAEPAVGSSLVPQTDVPSWGQMGPGVDGHGGLQRFLQSCGGHIQVETCPVEEDAPFSGPPRTRGQLLQPPYSCI